ncbi:MAG: glycogen debranching protein, partial [Bacteroidetes bacterium]
SLMKKVKRDRIIQDTGSGGAWPVSSDRTTWALAAWEIYKVTGDRNWLRQAFAIIKNTAEDDAKVLFSPETGMYRGESSFLDWREQTYPKWMSNMDIYVSQNLGTNVVHYQIHMILAEMAEELGEPAGDYRQRAETLKKGINAHLWMADKGFYGQYLYGRPDLMLSPRFEALGEALAVLFDVADPAQAKQIFEKSPVTGFGTTCIYPQIPGISPYHNNGIWPFVQAYWNLAAAKAGNEQALTHGLAAIYRAGGLFLTNYENFVAESGDFLGTEINSDRMLWSMAGNLAMVHRVFMGMSFEKGGIRFQPAIPASYEGTKKLSNFRYRNATLDITVEGHGNQVKSITMDGEILENAFLPGDITGKHEIQIVMANNSFSDAGINLVPNAFSLPNPQLKLSGTTLSWEVVPGATSYVLYKNGQKAASTASVSHEIKPDETASYQVIAEGAAGLSSFASEPLWVVPENRVQVIETEGFATRSSLPFEGFSGSGFVEITTTQNRSIRIPVNVPRSGKYLLDVRYSNGSGPWNTDNKCALRSLSVDSAYVGTWVFPQRGTDEWSDWGYSNGIILDLEAGAHTLSISLESWNKNMNTEVNRAMLDHLRIIELE